MSSTIEPLLEVIRSATEADASDEMRAAGAAACRTLLAALDARLGEPLAVPAKTEPTHHSATAAPPPHAAVQAMAAMLRGMTPDQMLDLAIARLRGAVPAGIEIAAVQPVKFQLVPIHR